MDRTILLKRMRLKREELTGYAFILPNFLGFFIFVLLPVIISLVMSFSKWSMAGSLKGLEFVGLKNYGKLIGDERFLHSVINNFYYTFVSVPVTVALSILVSVCLNGGVFLKKLLRTMFFMPHISSIVSIAVVWMVMFEPAYGPVNQTLRSLGISNPPGWFMDVNWAMPGLIIMSVWKTLGYNSLILLSGLQSIPGELYEAADIDGASPFRKLINITIPMLSPMIFFVFIMAIINSFKVFDQINIMTDGGPGFTTTVLVYAIYYYAFKQFKMGYASAIAWVLFLFIFLITAFQWKGQKKWVNY